jgi:ubiquitin C-terminal hydrolase
LSKTIAEKGEEETEGKYELKSIVIHSGGAYGGHYYCYTRDDLKEGNWNIEVPD